MATLTVRNLDDDLHARLRVRAAHNGRSMEAEVRAILRDTLAVEPEPETGLGDRIHALFADIEGDGLEIPERSKEAPRAAEFDR